MQKGTIRLKPYANGAGDRHLVETFQSSNLLGFGADGVTFDAKGTMYTANVEDGVIYKSVLDAGNRATSTILVTRRGAMQSCDGIEFNPRDGLIYVADFLGNTVHAVDPVGHVTTLHRSADSDGADGALDQPCEVIVRGNELVVVNMDVAWMPPPGVAVNTKVDRPFTIYRIRLPYD